MCKTVQYKHTKNRKYIFSTFMHVLYHGICTLLSAVSVPLMFSVLFLSLHSNRTCGCTGACTAKNTSDAATPTCVVFLIVTLSHTVSTFCCFSFLEDLSSSLDSSLAVERI